MAVWILAAALACTLLLAGILWIALRKARAAAADTSRLVAEARTLVPRVVFVDADNRVLSLGGDPAEVLPGSGLLRGDLTRAR